jgi:cytochrome b6-f complex subunit 5
VGDIAHQIGVSVDRLQGQVLPWIRSMIEPLLCGIVLGLVPVTLVGLFVAAWNQYRRGGSALGG